VGDIQLAVLCGGEADQAAAAVAIDSLLKEYAAKQGGEPVLIDGKYMSIPARQPDGSWKLHRDAFNSNVPNR